VFIAVYASETWVMKECVKQILLITERKVVRRISGATKERYHTWRIKKYPKLNNLIKEKNIINYIKAQRLSWFESCAISSDR
jgi:hypothetical protein